MAGKKRLLTVEALVGRDVEVRAGGQCLRGTLRSVGQDFIVIERPNGRVALVSRSAVVAIVEEFTAALREEPA